MRHWLMALVMLASVQACENKVGPEVVDVPQPDAFTGVWRSITESTEFVRLTVASLSREQGTLGTLLTFSGIYWEGAGRITGDSLVAQVAAAGGPTPEATLVAYFSSAGVLSMELRRGTVEPLRLSFVRDN